MEPPIGKHGLLRNILVRVLSFCVLVVATRFAYIVTVKGGSCYSRNFCFFPENVNVPAPKLHSSSSVSGEDRDILHTRKWRRSVEYYIAIFQDLIAEGSLSPNYRALCIETPTGEDVLALQEVGVIDSLGISKKPSPPLIVLGDGRRQPFDQDAFDFEFSGNGVLDHSSRPSEIAAEICRTLKPGGFLVVHTAAAMDIYSLNSFLELFNCCKLIRTRDINGVDSTPIFEIVMRKKTTETLLLEETKSNSKPPHGGNSEDSCSVQEHKRKIIQKAEPLIAEEPLKPWITLKRNIRNIKYLPSMVDISFKTRYAYIDVGARSYGSSIGSWFKKQYPKQNKAFEVFAIEADKSFHGEYKNKKGVNLLPFAAWLRNETLFFEITRDPTSKKAIETGKGRGMGRINPVQTSSSHMGDMDKILGFDFADWLKTNFSDRDFVVMKMDVEGTEFHLIPRLIETGAMCLIDELFLECHYNRWQRCCPGQRSPKYHNTYTQCLNLLTSLRDSGVLIHQWW